MNEIEQTRQVLAAIPQRWLTRCLDEASPTLAKMKRVPDWYGGGPIMHGNRPFGRGHGYAIVHITAQDLLSCAAKTDVARLLIDRVAAAIAALGIELEQNLLGNPSEGRAFARAQEQANGDGHGVGVFGIDRASSEAVFFHLAGLPHIAHDVAARRLPEADAVEIRIRLLGNAVPEEAVMAYLAYLAQQAAK